MMISGDWSLIYHLILNISVIKFLRKNCCFFKWKQNHILLFRMFLFSPLCCGCIMNFISITKRISFDDSDLHLKMLFFNESTMYPFLWTRKGLAFEFVLSSHEIYFEYKSNPCQIFVLFNVRGKGFKNITEWSLNFE